MIRKYRESQTELMVATREYRHSFTVFPDSLNYAGTLFGGKLLAEMDLAASNAARKLLYVTPCDSLVTAHIDAVDFKEPGYLGDIIEILSFIEKVGTTSITVSVKVQKEDTNGRLTSICNARFVFVAMKRGKPYPHNLVL